MKAVRRNAERRYWRLANACGVGNVSGELLRHVRERAIRYQMAYPWDRRLIAAEQIVRVLGAHYPDEAPGMVWDK